LEYLKTFHFHSNNNNKYKNNQMEQTSAWPLNGTAPEAYERYIVPAWMGAWTKTLIDSARVGPGDQVLDVACGTGIVARQSARLVGENGNVSGLDADQNMLLTAKSIADCEGLSTIEWHHGDAVGIPVETGKYSAVLCQQGLQFFSDRQQALKEIHRILIPGGRLALSIWRSIDRCPFLAILADVLGNYIGTEYTAAFYSSCSLSDREELRSLLSAAGFQDINIRLEVQVSRFPSVEEFIPGYISVFPFVQQIKEMSPDNQKKLLNDIKDSLQVFLDDNGLAAPMESHIVTATK
jgi:ubiquinone/menaquinone biosynthesis C-methylase UbiE